MPIAFDFSLDWTVLAFAVAVSVATAVVFGLAPAWSASRPDLVPALKSAAEEAEDQRSVLLVERRERLLIALLCLGHQRCGLLRGDGRGCQGGCRRHLCRHCPAPLRSPPVLVAPLRSVISVRGRASVSR